MFSLYRTLLRLGVLCAALASPSPRQVKDGEGLLECFEVSQPVLGPYGPLTSWGRRESRGEVDIERCEVLLMEHSFGFSYDLPFVGRSLYAISDPNSLNLGECGQGEDV